MSRLVRLATASALTWNRCYSAGLPATVRALRRAELASDLHEHAAWDADQRVAPADTAVHMLWRVLAGASADLTWRVRVARTTSPGIRQSTTTGRIPNMLTTIVRSTGLAFIATIALFLAGNGIGGLLESGGETWAIVYGLHNVVSGALLVAGLVAQRQRLALGVGLVVAGALSGALALYWMLPISIPLALVGIGAIALQARHVRAQARAA